MYKVKQFIMTMIVVYPLDLLKGPAKSIAIDW